jgi:heat shock protein HslJ
MVFSESVVEEYYACPNCLSKVASLREEPAVAETPKEAEAVEFGETVDVDEVDEVVEDEVAEPAAEVAVEGDVEGPAGCAHYLGYLKKRGKNTAIPEECLTCSKMIDCMY